jgi:probable DNA repair protein
VRRAAEEGGCPRWSASLGRVLAARRNWPARQSHAAWAASLEEFWSACGWPGERLGSADFQARVAFEGLVDEMAALDAVAPAVTLEAALARLRRLAAGRIFQPEAAPAPVEIMGWLEAAGQRFAAAWILGLDDATLPAGARPHPFLPPSLQRERGLPRATASGEAEFAGRIWRRLRASTGVLVASHAQADAQGNPLRPSPLLAGLELERVEAEALAARRVGDELHQDGAAPACAAGELRGGSALLREQSLCAFRAFAHQRLHARASEPIGPGLDAAVRGTLAHKLLASLWQWLESSARLAQLSLEELEPEVAARAAAVVAAEPRLQELPGLAALERERLTQLALEWLRMEAGRAPFRILALEEQGRSLFAGLELELRLDRMDELQAGGLAIVDYKTGADASAGNWEGWRPRDPQLPLYLVTRPQPQRVAGLALARVRAGAMRWVVRERAAGVVATNPGRARTIPRMGWEAQVREWQQVLERLADEYRSGMAAVDPLAEACETCDLHALCRIYERPEPEDVVGAEEDSAEADDE